MLKAYSPRLLPIELDPQEHIKLLRQTISVTKKITSLHEKFKSSPASGELFSLFSYFESIKSTIIEGTKTTFDEVMESKITKKKTLDIIEATNYHRAIGYGQSKVAREKFISLACICNLHKIVLKNSRGENKNPGCFREKQNWIGDNSNVKSISYVPPKADEVASLMKNLEEFINHNDSFEPLIAAGIMHAQFESIHPFLDGNGRVGRLLIPLYLLKNNVCGGDIIFVSDELEKNKLKYYSLLNGVRGENPQWFEWLSFFLTSVEKQVDKYLIKLDEIDEIVNKYMNEEKINKSVIARKVLLYCVSDPVINSTKIAESSGIALNSVN